MEKVKLSKITQQIKKSEITANFPVKNHDENIKIPSIFGAL